MYKTNLSVLLYGYTKHLFGVNKDYKQNVFYSIQEIKYYN